MAISTDTRTRLNQALTSAGAGAEVATALDALGGTTTASNNTWTGSNTFTGLVVEGRERRSGGTSVAAGDFALSAGFGSTASVTVGTGSNDSRGTITIAAAGTGMLANPTCTLTFKDGTWTTAPFAVVSRGGGQQLTAPVISTTTATTLVITFIGTPVAAESYVITYVVLG
jgi:hypothetical protein